MPPAPRTTAARTGSQNGASALTDAHLARLVKALEAVK